MNAEFLLYADVVLLLRLPLLLRNRPASPWAWWGKSALEIVLLGLVYRLHWGLVVLGAGGVVLNVLASPGRRFRAPTLPVLLSLLGVQLLVASVVFAPYWSVQFRPTLLQLGEHLPEVSALGGLVVSLLTRDALLVGFGLLLSANEANLLIRWSLEWLQLKPGTPPQTSITAREYERGRVIGLIERGLIYGFVLAGQFAAVGFVLAGKGFTRSRDLGPEDRDFAEYVIIGTLLSSGLAILLAAAVDWGLGPAVTK